LGVEEMFFFFFFFGLLSSPSGATVDSKFSRLERRRGEGKRPSGEVTQVGSLRVSLISAHIHNVEEHLFFFFFFFLYSFPLSTKKPPEEVYSKKKKN